MGGTIGSKGNFILVVQKLLAGLAKHYSGQTLTINGAAVAVADLAAMLDGYLDKMSTADGTKTLWRQQLKDARSDEPNIVATVVAIHGIVRGNLGAANAALEDFGMKPRSPSKRTTAEKAATVEKSLATRVARHTIGPKAKKAIHGTAAPARPVKPRTE